MKKKAGSSARKSDSSLLQPEQRKQRIVTAETETSAVLDAAGLLSDLRSLIQSARQRIATVAYSTQTLLCWHMGRRLLTENLQAGRAAYGKQILVTVSRELTAEYGRGFSYAEIARMVQFAHRLFEAAGERGGRRDREAARWTDDPRPRLSRSVHA